MRTGVRRLAAAASVLALAGGSMLLTSVAANAAPADKVTYCHATHSAKNPYVVITTAKVAVLRAHEKHQDDEDVIPAFSYDVQGVAGFFPGQAPDGSDPDSFIASGCVSGAPQ